MQDAQTWPKFRVCIRPVPAKICSNSRCDSLSLSKHFPTIKLQEHQHSFCFMFCLTFLQFQASPGKVCGEISHPKSWCRTAEWHKGLQRTSSWSVVKKENCMCVILYLCIVKELRQRHSGFAMFVTECSHAKCTITYSKVHIYINIYLHVYI